MALVCLFGPAAQMRFFPAHCRQFYASADLRQATGLLEYLAPEPRELAAYVSLIDVRAQNVMNMPRIWDAVTDLADALLSELTVRVAGIRAIVGKSIKAGSLNRQLTSHRFGTAHPLATLNLIRSVWPSPLWVLAV